VNSQDLKKFVEDNPKLVTMRPAGDGLYVLKYKKSVFFDDLWNEYLEECRGTIVDENFNIVSYPFTKIYNYGVESKAPVLAPGTMVKPFRKVNGFMAAITWHDGKLLVSTTGSTDSPYVDMIKELIVSSRKQYEVTCEMYSDCTFMFECVHPNDPHIIVETPGMYYLGHRKKEFGSSIKFEENCGSLFNCHTALHYPKMAIDKLCDIVGYAVHEGFVFYTDDGRAAKIKSPYYLTCKWVARNPRTDKLMTDAFKKQIDEEYYPLIDYLRENIEFYTSLDEQQRLAYVREFLER
jgi:hypothetical protein